MLINRRPATRHRWMIVAAVLTLVVGVDVAPLPTGAQSAPPTDGPAGALEDRYDEVLGAETALVVRIDASARRQVELATQLADLADRGERAAADLVAAERRLFRATATEARARAQLATARRRLTLATDALHEQAVASYIHGGAEDAVTAIVRGSTSAADVRSTLSYVDAVVDHQRQVINEFNAARADRDRRSRVATAARLDATNTRDDIAESRWVLARAELHTRELTDEAARQSMIEQATLNELQAKKLEIEARIVGLERESDGIGLTLAALQALQPGDGTAAAVLTNPIPGTPVSSSFGMRFHPILRYQRLHAGADLSAASGTPLRAAADGVVVMAGDRGGYGNCTVIDHGSGLATLYAHQSSIAVKPGQVVKRGDVIGRVGSTGLSTGPHLHFETRLRGVPVNPTTFVDF